MTQELQTIIICAGFLLFFLQKQVPQIIMAALHSRCGHYIFALWFLSFSLSFFPRLISAAVDWMSTPYFHTWCGLSANLECMSGMCCMPVSENTGCKKSPVRHHRTTLSGCIFAAKAYIDSRKKTCYTPIPPPHVLIIWWTLPTNGWDLLASLGHPCKFQRVSRLGSLTARHSSSWAWAKLCGIEQRAPSVFSRVAITLGIGPHSSCV